MLSFAPDDRKRSQLLTQGVRGTWSSLLRCHHATAVCSQVLPLFNQSPSLSSSSGLWVSPPPPSPYTSDLSGNSDLQQEGTSLAQARLTQLPHLPQQGSGITLSYHLQLRNPIDREHAAVNAKVRGQSL